MTNVELFKKDILSKYDDNTKYLSIINKSNSEFYDMVHILNNDFPDLSYLFGCINSNDNIILRIKSIDAINWSAFIMNGIRCDIIEYNMVVSQVGITVIITTNYQEKHLEQIQMLSQAYLIKAGHKLAPPEDDYIVDPTDYGLDPW